MVVGAESMYAHHQHGQGKKDGMSRNSRLLLFVLLGTFLFFTAIGLAYAAGPIVLDSQFGDWAGQPNVPDPQGDAIAAADVLAFFFGTNPNEETAYFMVQRVSSKKRLILLLRIDTNNNGVYAEPQDRLILVQYKPTGNASKVDVTLLAGTGQFIKTIANGADWGESKQEGGQRVEWGVTFADLGILPGQTIRMSLLATTKSKGCDFDDDDFEEDDLGEILDHDENRRCIDMVNEVQWSPANALGRTLVFALAVAGSLFLAWQRRRLG